MRQKRFYIEEKNLHSGAEIILSAVESRHINKVLRLKTGDTIIVVNDNGETFNAILTKVAHNHVAASIQEKLNVLEKPTHNISIILNHPKNSVIDSLIPKTVELGVNRIILFQGKRSVIKLNDINNKHKRIEKQIIAAMKQSGRNIKPEVHFYSNIQSALEEISILIDNFQNAKKFIFNTMEREKSFSSALKLQRYEEENNADRIIIPYILLFGAEGGLDKEEIIYATKNGFESVSLGESVLKVETAVISSTSILLSYLGEM